jgi:formimidoylglutamate deiminase
MPAYFAPRVLLATGWAHNVRLEVDDVGMLTAITPDATPDGSIPLSGPVVPGCQTCTLMPFSA